MGVFEHHLGIVLRDDVGNPSRVSFNLENFREKKSVKGLLPTIGVVKNSRMKEALVHELLHLKLIPMEFPRFDIKDPGDDTKGTLAFGIKNNADHTIMRPMYLELGGRVTQTGPQ